MIDSSLLSLSVCVRLGSTPGSSFGPGIPLKKFQIDQRSTARGRARKNFRTFTVRVGSTFVPSYESTFVHTVHFFFLVFMMSYSMIQYSTSITKVRKYFVLPYNTYIRNITYCTEVRRYFISYESTKVLKYFRKYKVPSYESTFVLLPYLRTYESSTTVKLNNYEGTVCTTFVPS